MSALRITLMAVLAAACFAGYFAWLLFGHKPPSPERPQGNPVFGIMTSLEPIFSAPKATRPAVGCTGSRCLVCVDDEYAKVNCYLVRLDTGKGPVR